MTSEEDSRICDSRAGVFLVVRWPHCEIYALRSYGVRYICNKYLIFSIIILTLKSKLLIYNNITVIFTITMVVIILTKIKNEYFNNNLQTNKKKCCFNIPINNDEETYSTFFCVSLLCCTFKFFPEFDVIPILY